MEKKIVVAGVLACALLVATPVVFFLNKHTSPATPTSDTAPQKFSAYFQQANELYQKGDYAQAASFYAQALKEKSDVVPVYFNFGLTLEKLGKPTGALAMYKHAIQLDKRYINPYLHIAEILKKQKNYATALAVVDEALKLDPRNEQSRLVKTEILFVAGVMRNIQESS